MVKRAFSIRILVLLTAESVQAAFTHPSALHTQAEQTAFKNIMLNKSYPKHAFEK